MKKYLTAIELAAAAGVSPSTVWRLKAAGRIPFLQPGGRDHFVRFLPHAIELIKVGAKADGEEDTLPTGGATKLNARPAQSRLPGIRPKWMD